MPDARRLYRVLLLAFPAGFRRRFGDDMATVFADRWRRARRDGAGTAAVFFVRATVDALRHGVAERRLERHLASCPGLRERIMRALIEDARHAWRSLVRQPVFTVLAAGMLAVGLVFNFTLFAIVDAAVLRPLPYRGADRLMLLWSGRYPDGTAAVNSPADFQDWHERARSFSAMAAFNISLATLLDDDTPEEIRGSVVTREFFDVLATPPLVGRTFTDEDYQVTSERPLVISEQLWRRRFDADPGIVGRLVTLSDHPRRVVGVMPATMLHPEPFWYRDADYWSPLRFSEQLLASRSNRFVRVIARLDDGASLESARAEMSTINGQLREAYPETNAELLVVSLKDQLVGDTRPLFWLFLAACALVLFLAGTNIVNLLLARANRRRYELAVRTALGAARWRLGRQLMLEGTLLGVLAGSLGLLLSWIGVPLVVRRAPVELPGLLEAGLNARVLLAAVIVSVAAGAACGLVPALRVARARLSPTLSGARSTSGLETTRSRRWLVIAEIALATPLVVSALLLGQTLRNLQHVDPGFDPENALSFRLSLSQDRYPDGTARIDFFRRLEAGLTAIPGTVSAGIVTSLPMGGLNNTGGTISAVSGSGGEPREVAGGFRMATSGYFESMGIDVLRGSLFGDGASDLAAAVVNERLARELWGDEDPIGRQVRLGGLDSNGPWRTVVGVVGNVRHVRLTEAPDPEIFFPYGLDPWPVMSVVVRTDVSRERHGRLIQDAVRELDPRLAVVELRPVTDIVAGGWARARFGTLSAALFAVLGLTLAAGGTFAVLSLLVAARRTEISIRLALGAAPSRVRRLLLRQAMVPALVGCALGAAGAAAGAGLLSATLFGVDPRDPAIFVLSIAALSVAAFSASWWPASRAMRVDPVSALRGE